MPHTHIDTSTDGHVHTRLCLHARGEMEDYVRAAIDKGLSRLIFLEHFEIGVDYFERTWLRPGDFLSYQREGERLARLYRHDIEIGVGVEVGINPERFEETAAFLAGYPWQRIGISYHFLKTPHGHVNMVSRKQDNLDLMGRIGVGKVISAYFRGLSRAIEVLPGHVCCHLDAVLRRYPGVTLGKEHDEQIEEILDLIRAKGMALEVNTSGFRLRGEPYPNIHLLKKAQKKGIRLLAGSDAHRPEHVGAYFDRLPDLL